MSQYNVIVSERAKEELKKISPQLQILFLKHFKKLENHIPGKHLGHSNYFVEKVTKSTRIACELKKDIVDVIHCFGTHKEYEVWYKSLA